MNKINAYNLKYSFNHKYKVSSQIKRLTKNELKTVYLLKTNIYFYNNF